jgi:glycerol-1-phosphate dehydrogenase [NAD(P)+]
MIIGENETIINEVKFTQLPSIMCRGSGAINNIGQSLDLLGSFSRGLIVCDPITYGIAGKSIESILRQKGYDITLLTITDASMEELDQAIQGIRNKGIDIAFGVGGGRPIDIAKKSSFDEGIPFVSVPTSASHDGIGSARASIKINGQNTSLKAHPPSIIIADTAILKNAPYRNLAAGCGDVISNITAVRDWELGRDEKGEPWSEYAAELSLLASKLLIRHADDIPEKTEHSTKVVINALITSSMAMAIVDSSRPASGAEHKFSHTLDRLGDVPALHGEQCALGTIVCSHLQGGNWQEIRDVMRKIGIPTTAKELGLPRDLVIRALEKANDIRPERYTILRDGLTRDQAEKALVHVGIIG